jgi:hypothetical protein
MMSIGYLHLKGAAKHGMFRVTAEFCDFMPCDIR